MFIEQLPSFIRQLYPDACWRIPVLNKTIFLTFDDGPIPEVTPWVLNLLDQYDIKATFFMVGDNVRKHPDVYQMVVERGHSIGNHTFNHLQGIKCATQDYVANVQKANEYIHATLFRPPHGIMRMSQYHALCKHFRIVMWDLVTRDYNPKLKGEEVLQKVKHYVRPGSIITFHDSLRSVDNLHYALPRAIEWLLQEGYQFQKL